MSRTASKIGIPLVLAAAWVSSAAGRTPDPLAKMVPGYALHGTLQDVIPQLGNLGGVKISVDWPALEAAGVKRTAPVRLRGENTEFLDVVELVLAQVEQAGRPLAWRREREGTLLLTTQAKVLGRLRSLAEKDESSELPPGQGRRPASVDLRFERVRLEDVLETLRNAAAVNFFVNWPSLKTVGVTRDTPISLRAREVSIARALDLVMLELNGGKDRYTSVYWVVDEDMVRIDTGAVLDTIFRTRVMDVSDLLRITPDFPGPRIRLSSVGAPASAAAGAAKSGGKFLEEERQEDSEPPRESPAELRARQREQLVEGIRNSIGREMWYPEGKGTITVFQGRLVITQSLLGWKLLERGNR